MAFFLKNMEKSLRLRKNEQFQEVIKSKKSVVNDSFVVYYKLNDLSNVRIGISVSKKLGKAVVRNKIKRQVRMMARGVFDENENIDYIIIVRKKYLNYSYQENLEKLDFLHNKIKKRMESEKCI